MSEQQEEGKTQHRSAFERHAQTVVQFIIAGLCVWVASSVTSTQTNIAVINTKMENMEEQIGRIESSLQKSYTREDAQRDHELIAQKIEALSLRVENLEGN